MKRRAFTLIEALVIVAIVMIVAAVVMPMFRHPRETYCGPTCQSNLKHVGLGFRQYTQDYNEKYPVVKVGVAPFGWADALWPYIKSTQVFQCPYETNPSNPIPTASGYTDYWYNRQLSGVKGEQVKEVTQTILSGDGNSRLDVTDARYSKYRLPPRWISDGSSPAYRHLGGANYGFADGHVKWMKPSKVTNLPATRRMPTFAIR